MLRVFLTGYHTAFLISDLIGLVKLMCEITFMDSIRSFTSHC
jgi:hypothetical protein